MSVVLDSDVLIDVLRGIPAARDFLKDLSRPPVCSEVSRVEILRGMRSHERRATDLIVAAAAERLGLPLATHSVRHVPMFEGLEPAYRR